MSTPVVPIVLSVGLILAVYGAGQKVGLSLLFSWLIAFIAAIFVAELPNIYGLSPLVAQWLDPALKAIAFFVAAFGGPTAVAQGSQALAGHWAWSPPNVNITK